MEIIMKLSNWQMNFTEHRGISCKPPCSMYSVMIENKLIDDPFFGCNEWDALKLSDEDCEFICSFEADDNLFKKEYIELVFHGLDTVCDIYINGAFLEHTENMHRKYVLDVKKHIICGSNTILLKFSSPTKYYDKMWKRKHQFYTGDSILGSAYLRKGLYMAGWDWGPRLPDMGIFREVEIYGYDIDKIDGTVITQIHRADAVDLLFDVSTVKNSDCEIFAEIAGTKMKIESPRSVLTVEKPELWWVRGYGKQALYDIVFTLEKNGVIIDSAAKRIGLRTLEVSIEELGDGSEFCFVNNGVKIFSMGANYIPQDIIAPRITKETTKARIDDFIFANYNTIRVWGGGYYPEDFFYDMCDEAGIIVWQDFMIACLNIRLTEKMREELRLEAICNLKRLSHHASLGLLCGNNEIEPMISQQNNALTKLDYLEIYERMIPDLCEKYAPNTFYWPSSPSSGGGFENPEAHNIGDVHYWDVWHGNAPFEAYRKHKFRFCSEYGFESLPSIKTVKTFADEADMNLFSRVMENHQKCKSGNMKILMYLADNYLYPSSFEALIYASQLLQADAIRFGVEWFRKIRGYCMGSLYWQVNDCWPVASWSSVDYFGRYKALHYAARKFYAPVAIGLFLEDGIMSVNAANETRDNKKITVKWGICKNDNEVIREGTVEYTVPALSSRDVLCGIDLTGFDKHSTYFYAELYDENGNSIMNKTELLTKPKHFSWLCPDIKASARDIDGGVEISLSSNVFTKSTEVDFLHYDIKLSDNYIDLTSSKEYKIVCKTDHTASELLSDMVIRSVYDIK